MKVDSITVDYQPDPDPARAAVGWGAGRLWINNRLFWFSGNPDSPQPVAWTWLELLEHLTECWPWLCIESPWPLDWLMEPMLAGDQFWHVADDRWEVMDDVQADAEEAQVLEFAHHHNLAAGWHGLNVPALYWYRIGAEVRLCPEGLNPLTVPFTDAIDILGRLGDMIAAGLLKSDRPRVRDACAAWATRHQVTLRRQIRIAIGLDDAALESLQEGQTEEAFWGLSAAANDGVFSANALLAAARMTAGRIAPPHVKAILGLLRALPPGRSLPKLEALTAQLQTRDWRGADTPFTQGYALASALRDALGLAVNQPFEPAEYLAAWGVAVHTQPFGTRDLEAIAVWGDRGPAILVNAASDIRPAHRFGLRFVLAHELGHLLADRVGALPAAEVLGGRIVPEVEQRANAFAAELLLPREAAAGMYRQATSLEAAVRSLVEHFDVSRLVAKTQIKNSNVASAPDLEEIQSALHYSAGRVDL